MNVHRATEAAGKGTPIPTHFMQVLMSTPVARKKLIIPRLFATINREELSDVITIAVQDQRKWRVTLEKIGQDLYLQDGWYQFTEHYSIKKGYFVVFKYKGSSAFEVFVLDLSTTQVCYDNIKEEILGDDDESIQIKGSSSSPCSVPDSSKNKQSSKGQAKVVEASPDQLKTKNQKLKTKKDDQLARNAADVLGAASARKGETSQKITEAMKAASFYTTKNPSFIMALRKYNVKKDSCFMNVPTAFARAHFNLKPDVISVRHNGREWQVRCHYPMQSKMMMSKGWNKFVRDNELVEGDVCGFEAIQGGITVLEVTFFRSN